MIVNNATRSNFPERGWVVPTRRSTSAVASGDGGSGAPVAFLKMLLGILLTGGFFAPGALALEPFLEGTVRNQEGKPLPEIELFLFDHAAKDFDRERALTHGKTDAEGRFRLTTKTSGDALLKLVGTQGAGRVKVQTALKAEPLELTYPVRTTLTFLHDNDTHFNFNRKEAFQKAVAQIRKETENVFLLGAGDIFIRYPERWPDPRPEYYAERSRFMIQTMNELGYDALTLGNHELDYVERLTRASLELATFPLLAANVEITTDHLPEVRPYTVLETDNRYRIAVLGLSTVNFKKEGVRGLDAIETARQYIYLAEEHDLMVALTHIGHRTDRMLAEQVSGFDLIIGGHSHTLLLEGDEVKGVLIAQAGGVPPGHPVSRLIPKFLGHVTVVLENGKVVEKRGTVLMFY